jgi:hypothetical protein
MIARPLITLTQGAILITIAYTWIVEPRWRMRTITTIRLALSARVRNLSMASVAVFFGLLGFHVAQATLLIGAIGLNAAIWRVCREILYPRIGYSSDVIAVVDATSILSYSGILYFTYWAGRQLAWYSALRQAFKPER